MTAQARGPWRRFCRHRAALLGLAVLALSVVTSLALPAALTLDPEAQDLALGAVGPRVEHVFGTDHEGRDLLARTLHGARVSFLVGAAATIVAVLIGITWGAVAGWSGGRIDQAIMRLVDVLYGLPYMFFVIVLMVWLGRDLINVFIGLGAVSWLTMARVVRGQVRTLRHRDFVVAARIAGVRPLRIVCRHVLPNAVGPIVVYATLTVPRVMLEEAFLSFLGLGVQPPAASLGSLISDGAALYRECPWLLAFPGSILAVSLLALNFVGDGLRDAFDPRAEARS